MDELAIKDRLWLSLHREGYPFVLCSTVATVILGLIDSVFWLPGILLSVFLFFAFRLPNAVLPRVADALLSPATGTVLVAESGSEDKEVKAREPFVVRIGITVLDPAVLRFPLAGQVLRRGDHPSTPSGLDFRKARENAASVDLSVRASASDVEYALHLRAGVLGRHIALALPAGGEEVASASAFGFLRLGGVVEITFDADEYEPLVAVGQRVFAGESILALVSRAGSGKKKRGSGS